MRNNEKLRFNVVSIHSSSFAQHRKDWPKELYLRKYEIIHFYSVSEKCEITFFAGAHYKGDKKKYSGSRRAVTIINKMDDFDDRASSFTITWGCCVRLFIGYNLK